MDKQGPKRILFVVSRFLDGGIETVALDYLRKLAPNPEYQLGLAISTEMEGLEVFREAVPQNVRVYHFVTGRLLTQWRRKKVVGRIPFWAKCYDEVLLAPVRRFLIGRGLRKLAREYDVFIDFDCCHYAWLKDLHVKKVAWYHFSFQHGMVHDTRRVKRVGRHLACYDHVVVICRAMMEEGRRLFPWLGDKWRLIYNAKDEELLRRRADEPVEDSRIRVPYILSVERLEESQKDTTTLLHAYKMLKEQHHVAEKLYLLGKGRDRGRLEQLAVQLGLQDDVVFLGFSPNPFPWMLNARLIVHSAKMEGLPTAMIEALILGKLIVATDCPTGPREILADGKAGLLVPVGEPRPMAEAMHRLLTDEALQQDVLREASVHRKFFLFQSTLERVEELMTNL